MSEAATSSIVGPEKLRTVIALTGFMGSGKSTTGHALSELLGWEFLDLDEAIERQEGVSIREVFRQRGEEEFRTIEHRALKMFLVECSKPAILALGGGAYVQPKNVELIRGYQVRTVFLEAPLEEMLQRCGVKDELDPEHPRPLAADSTEFLKLYEERLPFYREADLTINTTGKSETEIANEIVEKLQPGSVR
jgi:shikimate kinase